MFEIFFRDRVTLAIGTWWLQEGHLGASFLSRETSITYGHQQQSQLLLIHKIDLPLSPFCHASRNIITGSFLSLSGFSSEWPWNSPSNKQGGLHSNGRGNRCSWTQFPRGTWIPKVPRCQAACNSYYCPKQLMAYFAWQLSPKHVFLQPMLLSYLTNKKAATGGEVPFLVHGPMY